LVPHEAAQQGMAQGRKDRSINAHVAGPVAVASKEETGQEQNHGRA